MAQLAELYDADKRTRDPRIRELAAKNTIPHPLNTVQYADGISRCRHAKRHQRFQFCQRTIRVERFDPGFPASRKRTAMTTGHIS
ncbi:hypothetical protein [Arthrobacter bambusae]|uniref:Uncharacterized protein n=1 Tax=Arthrobacter bambusae TaxID=1338426 RepID=A0AAW8DIF3_9MICC|nr:hypothetical protein [Arthrobacter bambusae]MDP9904593.1 hypothetical protein [Arthrobacter bambusae]MDQ0129409.1 hypothetical protein [Arthrobacter bambusae]MDQ0180978.1 hypothetical protein [Arthrobacter bambusae]